MMPGSPSQRETALLLLRSPQTFVWLNPMVSRSSFHFSAAFNTVGHSHLKRFRCLFFWLLRYPSGSTCLLPTWSPLLSFPGWPLLFTSILNLGIPPGRGPLPSSSSLPILSPQLVIHTWVLNTSCMLIIPKFTSHPQTSTLNTRHPLPSSYWVCTFTALSRPSNVTCQIRTPSPEWPFLICSSPTLLHLSKWHAIHPVTQAIYLDIILDSLTSIALMNPVGVSPKYISNPLLNSKTSPRIKSTVISCLHYRKGWFPNFYSHSYF